MAYIGEAKVLPSELAASDVQKVTFVPQRKYRGEVKSITLEPDCSSMDSGGNTNNPKQYWG